MAYVYNDLFLIGDLKEAIDRGLGPQYLTYLEQQGSAWHLDADDWAAVAETPASSDAETALAYDVFRDGNDVYFQGKCYCFPVSLGQRKRFSTWVWNQPDHVIHESFSVSTEAREWIYTPERLFEYEEEDCA